MITYDSIRATLRLAIPVMIAYAGHMIVVITDNIMVGQYSTTQFAGTVFANSVFMNVLVFAFAFGAGITPLIGEANGAKDDEKLAYVFRHGMISVLRIGVLLTILCSALYFALPYFHQPATILPYAEQFFALLCCTILPITLFAGMKSLLDGTENPRPATVITIIADVLNVIGNYILIYGKFGFPELGAKGAAISTLISRLVTAIALGVVIWNSPRYKHVVKRALSIPTDGKGIAGIMKMCLPTSLQGLLEVMGFTLGTVMMGWLGENPLAAHQVVLGVASFTFMIANGTAVATTIRVSNYFGEKNYTMIRSAVYTGLALVVVFMSLCAMCFILFGTVIPLVYTSNTQVIAIAGTLFVYAAVFQVFDGTQVLMMNTLRGIQDVKIPTAIAFVGYALISLPVAYLFAFVLEFGPIGIWIGYCTALVIVATSLWLRFNWKSKQMLYLHTA